jgi:acetolactate synthase-1/2/3 large subunit
MSVKITGYNYDNFAPKAYKIIVGNNIGEIKRKNIKTHKQICIDVPIFLEAFLDSVKGRINKYHPGVYKWKYTCKSLMEEHRDLPSHLENRPDGYLSSYYFARSLIKNTEYNIPIIVSNGMAFLSTIPHLPVFEERRMFGNSSLGSMGYGLPVAIGACIANDKKPVVCVEGDGSIHLNIQELQTVRHYNLPLKIFILNNCGYNSIRNTQNALFDRKHTASSTQSGVSLPDYARIANAYRISHIYCTSNEVVDSIIRHCMKIDGPIICEVIVSPNETVEPRVIASIKDGKIVTGNLEEIKYND